MSLMINLRALKGASIAANGCPSRAYLRSVFVCVYNTTNVPERIYDASREGQALLVSTDGHRLVYGPGEFLSDIPLPHGIEAHNPAEWVNTIMPVEMVKAMLRVKLGKEYRKMQGAEYVWLHRQGDNLRAVFYDGQVITGKVYNENYPDWQRVLNPALEYKNSDKMANGLAFCGRYLADLADFGAAFGAVSCPVKMLGCPDHLMSPVLFESKNQTGMFGLYLLMPMRL